jgi:hypothetical protein
MVGATRRDVRLERTAERMVEQIASTGTLVVRDFSPDRNGEMAAHRVLGAEKISVKALMSPHVARTVTAARGRTIVAVQDTTEVNFRGREARRTGLGPAGDGVSKGFFTHALVAVD